MPQLTVSVEKGSLKHRARLKGDKGEDGAGLEVEAREVTARDVLERPLRPGGGWVMRIESATP